MTRKNRTHHEIEYEDAPSGYVTFYNYKEPLMRYEQGFGYVGALVFDGETDKVQCHLCGEWFAYLSPHIFHVHNMKTAEYKNEVGLLQTTALISETMREKLIHSGLNKRLQNLRNWKGKHHSEETKRKISETLKANAHKEETLNIRGTCPAQLIDRLQKKYAANPENWRIQNIKGIRKSLKKVFGTVKQACLAAGVPYMEPCKNWKPKGPTKHTRQEAIDFVKQFIIAYKRAPVRGDFLNRGHRYIYEKFVVNKSQMNKIVTEAFLQIENYIKTDINVRYTDEQLLNFLRKFAEINKRLPSYSDCKRGLLPPLSTYSTRFKGFKNAMKLAFKDNQYEG